MNPKDKVNQAVIKLWLALRELSDEYINDPSKMPKEDLDLLMPITNHSAIQNTLAKYNS